MDKCYKALAKKTGFQDILSNSKDTVTSTKRLDKGKPFVLDISDDGHAIYVPTQGRENNRQTTENRGQFSPETPREISLDTVRVHGDLHPLSYKSMHLQQHTHTHSYRDRSDKASRATISDLKAGSTEVLLIKVDEGPDSTSDSSLGQAHTDQEPQYSLGMLTGQEEDI